MSFTSRSILNAKKTPIKWVFLSISGIYATPKTCVKPCFLSYKSILC